MWQETVGSAFQSRPAAHLALANIINRPGNKQTPCFLILSIPLFFIFFLRQKYIAYSIIFCFQNVAHVGENFWEDQLKKDLISQYLESVL